MDEKKATDSKLKFDANVVTYKAKIEAEVEKALGKHIFEVSAAPASARVKGE